MPTLQKGAKVDLVKRIQERLFIGGYEAGAIDGNFSNRLEKSFS